MTIFHLTKFYATAHICWIKFNFLNSFTNGCYRNTYFISPVWMN
ncbi:MAG TPA: hypothetical protein [Caudoviricetes sp.]|nr:MAG TPA: hypothetical protein [Caudoviricetes sp.]